MLQSFILPPLASLLFHLSMTMFIEELRLHHSVSTITARLYTRRAGRKMGASDSLKTIHNHKISVSSFGWTLLQIIMCDNAVVVNAINARSVRGQTIDPIQLLFLTAALYDTQIASEWLSSEDNWIADALSRFEFDKIADMFPQFRNSPSHRPCRETGKPMSELRAKLRTFFGMGSLPTLAESTEWAKQHMQDSQVARDSSHSLSNSKRSL